MVDPLSISIIVLTKNEKIHIKRCIENLQKISNNIYVVDSGSKDKTIDIAQSLGANVLYHPWKNYADQFNWALENCNINTEWVMRFDADEYLTPELIDEIKTQILELSFDVNGIYINRRHHFLGRWIKHGGRYPLTLLRIWRNGKATVENRWMDEHMVLSEGSTICFKNDLVDDNLNTIDWFVEKHNKYATREMIDILNQKYHWFELSGTLAVGQQSQAGLKRTIKEKIYNKLPIFFRPTIYFIYRYIFQLGFLDGIQGFAYHFMQGFWYRCLVDLKCYEVEELLEGVEDKDQAIKILKDHTGLDLD